MPDDKELQSPENWDFASAERRKPTRQGRAVVSVAFQREEFERVAAAAVRDGKSVSSFIRGAALDKARGLSIRIESFSGRGFTVGTPWEPSRTD